jgi:D-sedoheptulose 7-phosphate isomerase
MSLAMDYIRELQAVLDTLPMDSIEQVVSVLHQVRMDNRHVFIMGNGGSAATASHFVCDLAKNTRQPGKPHFKVIGLTDNTPVLTALANDEGYENVFVQQLENMLNPGDIVIAISASGNSLNVLKAVDYARRVNAVIIGFTGYDGGKLGLMVDLNVHVKSNCIEIVEDIHLVLEHIIIKSLKAMQQPVFEGATSDIVQVTESGIAH